MPHSFNFPIFLLFSHECNTHRMIFNNNFIFTLVFPHVDYLQMCFQKAKDSLYCGKLVIFYSFYQSLIFSVTDNIDKLRHLVRKWREKYICFEILCVSFLWKCGNSEIYEIFEISQYFILNSWNSQIKALFCIKNHWLSYSIYIST